jgi:hypothetical protein
MKMTVCGKAQISTLGDLDSVLDVTRDLPLAHSKEVDESSYIFYFQQL